MFPNKSKTDNACNVSSLKRSICRGIRTTIASYFTRLVSTTNAAQRCSRTSPGCQAIILRELKSAFLDDNAEAISRAIGSHRLVVELGSGSSRKTLRLLKALDQPAGYVPVDISADYLRRGSGGPI